MRKFLIILLSIPTIVISQNTEKELTSLNKKKQITEARKSVKLWTTDLKELRYNDVYSGLSPENKAIYDSIEWVEAIEQMMMPFGNLIERTEISSEFNDHIDGLENGYYVTFKYKCNYENTDKYSEEIIMKQDYKKNWKVLLFSYDFIPNDNYKE